MQSWWVIELLTGLWASSLMHPCHFHQRLRRLCNFLGKRGLPDYRSHRETLLPITGNWLSSVSSLDSAVNNLWSAPPPSVTEHRSWLHSCFTMASSPVREFLVTYLMPEKCYEEMFVHFRLHGEAARWNVGVRGWNVATELSRCAGHVFASLSLSLSFYRWNTVNIFGNLNVMWATVVVIFLNFLFRKVTFWLNICWNLMVWLLIVISVTVPCLLFVLNRFAGFGMLLDTLLGKISPQCNLNTWQLQLATAGVINNNLHPSPTHPNFIIQTFPLYWLHLFTAQCVQMVLSYYFSLNR